MRKNLVTKNILKEWRNFEANISSNEIISEAQDQDYLKEYADDESNRSIKYKVIWDLGELDPYNPDDLKLLDITFDEAINLPDEIIRQKYCYAKNLPQQYTDSNGIGEDQIKENLEKAYAPEKIYMLEKIHEDHEDSSFNKRRSRFDG